MRGGDWFRLLVHDQTLYTLQVGRLSRADARGECLLAGWSATSVAGARTHTHTQLPGGVSPAAPTCQLHALPCWPQDSWTDWCNNQTNAHMYGQHWWQLTSIMEVQKR